MTHNEALSAQPLREQRVLMIVFGAMAAIGLIAFLVGASGESALRTWQAYLVNYLFWTGLTAGCVLFSAILTITNARWGRPIKRIAEAPGAFLPVAFILFWPLVFGRKELYFWVEKPIADKAWWLNSWFLFARDGLGLLALTGLAVAIIYHSVQSDLKVGAPKSALAPHFEAQVLLTPIYAVVYAFILSLLSMDLIMALDPEWISTLFPAYFFMASFYTALAAIIILSAIAVRWMGLSGVVRPNIFHDLGKLLFAFCVVNGDFFYAQFLVIWYGNLPEEARYVIERVRFTPWDKLAWVVLLGCFVIPFLILIRRSIKFKPFFMLGLSTLVLVGMWHERLLLVAPSIWKSSQVPIGFIELFIAAGFLGGVGLCVLLFFQRFPLLPVSDPLFREAIQNQSRH